VSAHHGSAEGRETRFTELFARSYGPVLGYVRRRVGTESAEDIVAEVFFTAWRHLDRAPPEALPWLYRIAWNAIGNQRRGQARHQRLQQRAEVLAPLRVADHADEVAFRDTLAIALDALAEPDREVLRLICWEDLDPADAARVLGCSTATLRVRLHRARKRLARLVQGAEPPHAVAVPHGARQDPVSIQEKR
jgi:RNA polymerase sigma-70 factor (ECF subfamily)